MFLKNNAHPAYATAGSAGSAEQSHRVAFSSATFAAGSEADDVSAFGFGAGASKENAPRSNNPPPRRRPPQQKRRKDNRPLYIGIAAAAAFVLVLLLIIIGVASSDKNIEMEDNAYLAFEKDGSYSVSVNGTVIEEAFEGEVTVRPAADRSFAYVVEENSDGYRVFLLKGKKLELITMSPVISVLAYADYEPGIVYEVEDKRVNIYTEKYGEDRITSNPNGYDMDELGFIISGDASTVIYTQPNDKNPNLTDVRLYRNGEENQKISQNVTPVALSIDGSYVYISGTTQNSTARRLYYINTEDEEYEPIVVGKEGNFTGIISMSVSGEEVIYYTEEGTETATYIYSMNRKNKEDDVNPSVKVGRGIYKPLLPGKEIACFETFQKCYLEGYVTPYATDDELLCATYFVDKKYTALRVATALGQFSDDGEYFYYISNEDDTLMQVDLGTDSFDRNRILGDVAVQDFAITAKGNLYFLNDEGKLSHRKLSASKNTPISLDVESISMMDSSNTLFFMEKDSNIIYSTKEGSEKEIAKFDGVQLTALPEFVNPEIKRTYAIVNDDAEGYCIYYTSNAKSFKRIVIGCEEIEFNTWLENLLAVGEAD